MMHSYKPKPPLSDYIHEIWLWKDYHPPHSKERILPFGTMELIVNLSDEPMTMFYPYDGYKPHSFYGPIVAGPRSEFFLVDTSRPASVLGVFFKFGAAMSFFGTSGRDLLNFHAPLDVFWGVQAMDLYCQLLHATTPLERFHIVEAALLRRLHQRRHHVVDFALNAFNRSHNVSHVIDQIGISPTRFIQVFSEEVGLTPKRFCRVLRFQDALKKIVQSPSDAWADIALNSGYYDQSHFINDFQTFAGMSPTLYIPQHPDHRSNLAFLEEK
jgi:AraC-like DNA-binding protein